MNKVAVVLLTWQRIPRLSRMLQSLSEQTRQDFDIYISNGNIRQRSMVDRIAREFNEELDIWVRHDGNEYKAFRRLFVGRDLAEQGYKTILFLDDDVQIPKDYLDLCINQYQPKTYQSGFAWNLTGRNYYKERERIWKKGKRIKYCGTGISMVDARLFLEKGLIEDAPAGALKIEDLWMSFYVDHVLKNKKWKLKYMHVPNTIVGGGDKFALYREVQKASYDKADFLSDLVDMGWEV